MAMTTLIETDNADTAYERLSSLFNVPRFTAPAERTYVRIEGDRLGPVGLHHLSFGMECEIDGPPLSAYYFGQLATGRTRYRTDSPGWERRDYGPGDVFLAHRPGIPWHADVAGADLKFASFDAALLAEVAEAPPRRRAAPVGFTGHRPATAQDRRLWRNAFRYVRDQIAAAPLPPEGMVASASARLLAAAALAAFPNNALTDPTAQDRHDASLHTLRRALAFIDEHADQDISMADVAAASFVTIRAVQLAFRRHQDVTPTEYLRRVRLESAHRDLKDADDGDGATVTSIAYRWGFASPSRFSADYRRAYGVVPSHTIHRG